MTLDEAIEHCMEQSEIEGVCDCAAEHRQLAEWLKELKELKSKKVMDDDIRSLTWDVMEVVEKELDFEFAEHGFPHDDVEGRVWDKIFCVISDVVPHEENQNYN